MKKHIVFLALTVAVAKQATADEQWPQEYYSVTGSTMIVSAPTISMNLLSQNVSKGLKNDLVLVHPDALVALETGVLSVSLKSVLERARQELDAEVSGMSDSDLLDFIYVR